MKTQKRDLGEMMKAVKSPDILVISVLYNETKNVMYITCRPIENTKEQQDKLTYMFGNPKICNLVVNEDYDIKTNTKAEYKGGDEGFNVVTKVDITKK